jgi:lipopolysaccharide transport system permease protein
MNDERRTMNEERMTSNEITVYRPNQRHELSLLETWIIMARSTWASREMIWQLVKRDITAQYKKSFIGMAWILAAPIMAIVPWLFATHVKLYDPGELEIPLLVYLIVGRSMWSVFTGFYSNGATTLGAGGGLMLQVNFSHEAMLTKQVVVGLFGFLLSFGVTLVVMFAHHVYPVWGSLLFPLTLLPLFFLGASLGLIVTMVKIVAYDLNRVIDILWGFALWTTPVLYSNKVPSELLQVIIKWNPLTYLVCTSRDMLLFGRCYNDQWGVYLGCCAVSLVLFLLSLRLFYVSENKLVERMV